MEETIDYDYNDNDVKERKHDGAKHFGSFTSPSETCKKFMHRQIRNLAHFLVEDWCLSAVLGIVMAILSASMDYGKEYLQIWHFHLYSLALQHVSNFAAFGTWVGFAIVLIFISATFVQEVAPQAAGSGIPEVKTIMRGVVLKEYFTFRVLVAKIAALVLALGSGLPIGKEGPFVHIAAVIATELSKLTARCHRGVFTSEFRYSEMLATACAVGMACTLNAPIGGVLYSIEVTSFYFPVRNYWKSFFAACSSAIVFRILRVYLYNNNAAITSSYQTDFPNDSFLPQEIPYFALLGILCGLLGALFICTHRHVALFIKHNVVFKRISNINVAIYPMVVALVVSSITYPDGIDLLTAGQLNRRLWLRQLFSKCSWQNATALVLCDQPLFDNWTGKLTDNMNIFITLCCFIVIFFLLSLVCYTLPIPCGIFFPVFIIGAAIGRLVGETIAYHYPNGIEGVEGIQIYAGIYAIVGAAAFTGAVTHTSCVCVIVFEMTGQIVYMLPVIIAVLFANAVCTYIQPSIYDSAIQIQQLPFLPELPPSRSSVHVIKAEQIMVLDIKFITTETTYAELKEILVNSPNLRSFPVVTDKGTNTAHKSREFCLVQSRDGFLFAYFDTSPYHHISVIKKRPQLFADTRTPFSKERERTYSGIPRSITLLSKVEDFVTESNSEHNDQNDAQRLLLRKQHMLDKPIDIDGSIDPAPFQLVEGTSIYKVHRLFTLLTLNHAYVTKAGRLVGVIGIPELRKALNHIYVLGAMSRRPRHSERITTTESVNETIKDVEEETTFSPAEIPMADGD